MIRSLALVALPALVAYAAASDLFTMRIANWLVVALAAAYVLVAVVAGLPFVTIGWSLVCATGFLLSGLAMFAMGWVGGGDAKLGAAIMLWMGLAQAPDYLVVAALLGGLLTLALLALRRYPLPPWLARHGWIDRLHDSKTGVPYGIALAAGALLVYPETEIFKLLVGV